MDTKFNLDSKIYDNTVIIQALENLSLAFIELEWMEDDCIIINWNKAAERIFGFTKEDAIHQSILALIIPKEEWNTMYAVKDKLKTDQAGFTFSLLNTNKFGKSLFCDWNCAPLLDDKKEIHGFLAIISENTSLWEAERTFLTIQDRLTMVHEISKIGFLDLKHLSNTAEWSAELIPFLGEMDIHQPPSIPATMQKIMNSLHPEDRDWVYNRIISNITHRISTDQLEARFFSEHGSIHYMELRILTRYDADGSPMRSSITIQDITAHKKVEEELTNALQELEQISAMKTDFIAQLSHEVKTPINAIMGYAQLLKMNPSLSDEYRDYILGIQSGSVHISNIINEMMNYSKIETGNIDLHNHPLNLKEMLDPIYTMLEISARAKDIHFSYYIQPSVPEVIHSDVGHLKRILVNLLSNAIKYTEHGYVKLLVEHLDQAVRFKVEDSGMGIDKEQQAHIFDPFFRIKNTRVQVEGIGLGLAIAKKIIEAMGGKIYVDSIPGEGSCFWFDIPVITDELIQADTINKGFEEKPDRQSERNTREESQPPISEEDENTPIINKLKALLASKEIQEVLIHPESPINKEWLTEAELNAKMANIHKLEQLVQDALHQVPEAHDFFDVFMKLVGLFDMKNIRTILSEMHALMFK